MTTTEAADQATITTRPDSTPKRRPGLNIETLALSGLFMSLFAFAAAIFAVGLSFRAIDEHDAIAAAGGAAGPGAARVEVALSEFMIMPEALSIPAGSILSVTNEGAVEHNLSVAELMTPNLASGDQAELDISGLAPGTYAVVCAIPGHKEAGMATTLTIK